MDDGTMSDQHFLDISERLVELIRQHPNSNKQRSWRDMLDECGEILRYRILKDRITNE